MSRSMEVTRIDVELGPRAYPVLIGSGLLERIGALLREQELKQTNAFVITNVQVGGFYFKRLDAALRAAG